MVVEAEEPVKEPAQRGRPPGHKNRKGRGWEDAGRGNKTKPAVPARTATAPAAAAATVAPAAAKRRTPSPSSNHSAAARALPMQVAAVPALLRLPAAVFRDLIVT